MNGGAAPKGPRSTSCRSQHRAGLPVDLKQLAEGATRGRRVRILPPEPERDLI